MTFNNRSDAPRDAATPARHSAQDSVKPDQNNLSAVYFDLSAVDFSAVDLSAVDLSAVDLSAADLSGVDPLTIEGCDGGGDPRISELVEEARKDGYRIPDSSIDGGEPTFFCPDGYTIKY